MVSIIITTAYRVASYTANSGMISICYSYLYYVKETECMSKDAGCMSEIVYMQSQHGSWQHAAGNHINIPNCTGL